ncbi:hypothetical protein ACFFLS_05290 [Flavobacterium procerum]|uniref:DNA primase n=1 Tax=Flavobacterium procerum TaxID=1455569 RepID=A0ABV6BLW8_9FLAO
MNIEEKENYNLEDQNFQNRERYEDPDIDAPPANHSISNNAEPDYRNDLESQEFGTTKFDNENLGNEKSDIDEFATDELDNDELDNDELDNEFDNDELEDDVDDDEIDNDDLDNEDLGNLDDEEGTNPDRNL